MYPKTYITGSYKKKVNLYTSLLEETSKLGLLKLNRRTITRSMHCEDSELKDQTIVSI